MKKSSELARFGPNSLNLIKKSRLPSLSKNGDSSSASSVTSSSIGSPSYGSLPLSPFATSTHNSFSINTLDEKLNVKRETDDESTEEEEGVDTDEKQPTRNIGMRLQ